MAGNSIKSNLTEQEMMSDIRMCLAADIKREKVFLIVEGDTDIRFMQSFLRNDNVYIYESYDGKNGVVCIAGQHFAEHDRVIGIRDRDYQTNNELDKIFYYDYGCMEMMIIKNDDVFRQLYAEYYRGQQDYLNLRMIVLEGLKFLSVIRMLNERNRWDIEIREVSINRAWNGDEERMDNDEILRILNQRNHDFFEDRDEELQQIREEYEREWSEEDFLNYTQGHDFFMLFAAICNHYNNHGVGYSAMEASCRCAFREADFVQTNLYRDLDAYETQHGLSVLSKKCHELVK